MTRSRQHLFAGTTILNLSNSFERNLYEAALKYWEAYSAYVGAGDMASGVNQNLTRGGKLVHLILLPNDQIPIATVNDLVQILIRKLEISEFNHSAVRMRQEIYVFVDNQWVDTNQEEAGGLAQELPDNANEYQFAIFSHTAYVIAKAINEKKEIIEAQNRTFVGAKRSRSESEGEKKSVSSTSNLFAATASSFKEDLHLEHASSQLSQPSNSQEKIFEDELIPSHQPEYSTPSPR